MTRNIFTSAKTIAAIALTLGLMGIVIMPAIAQQSRREAQYTSAAHHASLKNAPAPVNLVKDLNEHAKAVKLNSFINTGHEDIKPRLAPCGKRMYFSRLNHPDNANGVQDQEDIWYTDYNSETSQWSEPLHMNSVLNNAGPNFVNNISTSGDTLILGNQYLKKGKMRDGLSYSVKVDGQWSAPINIEIENHYNMSAHGNAFVALKKGVIISAVERVEGSGHRDLYVSFLKGNKATEPVNMGSIVNTVFEESSPYLAPDNETLYFASRGHNGFGGFDIYVTRRLDDTWTNWSTPENLGPAVNSALDDEFFSTTNCGKFAVFSRQVTVHNTDLYRISMEELYAKPNSKPVDSESVDPKNSAVASL